MDAIDSTNTQLTVTRQQKGSTAAEYARGTGMYIHSRGTLEIDDRYDYTYVQRMPLGSGKIGKPVCRGIYPKFGKHGALLTATTAEKLDRLNPSKRDLAQAWIKPTDIIGSPGDTSTILYHKNGDTLFIGDSKRRRW